MEGKVAVITGGGTGQGLATAKLFAQEGAYVYIFGRRQSELDKAAAEIGRNVGVVRGDVSNLADLDDLYAKVSSEKGKFDVLFANAGIVEPQPLADLTEASFDRQFAVNTKGLAFTVSKALSHLNDGASIVLVTSIADRKGLAGLGIYSATKAAVGSFVRSWTPELAERRIRINAVCPGPIDTDIFQQVAPSPDMVEKAKSAEAARVALKRLGRPEEIAAAVLFLASDDSSFVAGVDFAVDGGMTAI